MAQLSKEAKNRLEEVVLLCSSIFSDNRGTLRRLHVGRPDSFASSIVRYIPMHWDLRNRLHASDFAGRGVDARHTIIAATIRRLVRKGKLARDELLVPVLVAKGTPRSRVEQRKMICYWPITVLDKLANC